MEQTKKNQPVGAGLSKRVQDGNLNGGNYTTKPQHIQPRFSVDDVDRHLSRFNIVGQTTKRIRMIAWLHLCAINGYTVTRFDSLKVGCSCWNTTASEIGTKAGLRLERRDTKRRTRFSESTHVCEYWFDNSELPVVENFLGGFRQEAAA